MPRVLATTCWHVDNRARGFPRAPDVLQRVREMVLAANAGAADLFLFLGDLMEGHRPDQRAWELLCRVADELRELRCPLLMLAGNHDQVDVVELGEGLPAGRWLASPVSVLARMLGSDACAVEDPTLVPYSGFSVLALPHCGRAVSGGEDPGAWLERRAGELIDAHANARGPFASPPNISPLISASHLELPDIRFCGSEAEMRRGGGAALPRCVRESLRVAAVVNGHYHAAQEVPRVPAERVAEVARTGAGGPWDPWVRMPGAPERHRFGEGGPKGYLWVTV